MKKIKYSKNVFEVAGLHFEVLLPQRCLTEEYIPSFTPFLVSSSGDRSAENLIFKARSVSIPISYHPDAALLSEDFGAFGDTCRLLEYGSNYFLDLRYLSGGGMHQMRMSRDFSQAHIFIDWQDPFAGQAISFFLMFAYAQRCVLYNTILLHASVVVKDSIGVAFLGKSGTGKSTHSSLWVRYLDGICLLNDDNPALYFCENSQEVFISGTPWSGKTHCYKNRMVKLGALVRLEQSSENQFSWLSKADSLLCVLPGCSSLRWNFEHYMLLCDLVEKLAENVAIGYLKCLPNKSAVQLCYEQIKIKLENEKI